MILAAVCDACFGTGRGMEDESDGYAHSTGRPCFTCRGSGRVEFIVPDENKEDDE